MAGPLDSRLRGNDDVIYTQIDMKTQIFREVPGMEKLNVERQPDSGVAPAPKEIFTPNA